MRGRGQNTENIVSLRRLSLEPAQIQGFQKKKEGNLTLYYPKRNKYRYTDKERWFRSLVLDDENNVVSVGFPKFFNKEEEGAKTDVQILQACLQKGEPVYRMPKIDGSLIIRSVYKNQVLWRTRQTLDGGRFKEKIKEVAKKYPKLEEPAFAADKSLLFEFVSPDSEYSQVIKYDNEDLLFLNAVSHRDLRLASKAEKEELAFLADLNRVEEKEMGTSLKEAARSVKDMQGEEGIVLVCNQGQTLIKVKSDFYLNLHRLKHNFSKKEVLEVIKKKKLSCVKDFDNYLDKQAVDFETASQAKEIAAIYFSIKDRAKAEINDKDEWLENNLVKKEEIVKREDRDVLLLLWEGKYESALKKHENDLLEENLKDYV